jgi:hypothetical protein
VDCGGRLEGWTLLILLGGFTVYDAVVRVVREGWAMLLGYVRGRWLF